MFQLFILILVIVDVLSVFFELFGTQICTNPCFDSVHKTCYKESATFTKHMLKNCESTIVGKSELVNGTIVHNYMNDGFQCPKTRVLNDELLDYALAVLHITSISILWFLMTHHLLGHRLRYHVLILF